MSKDDGLHGWVKGSEPTKGGFYAVIDSLFAVMLFAYWNQTDRRWSANGVKISPLKVSHYRPAPRLPDEVQARWGPADF